MRFGSTRGAPSASIGRPEMGGSGSHAATTTTGPVYNSKGRLVQAPFAPTVAPAKLNEKRATAIFLRNRKVADWLARYPTRDRVTVGSPVRPAGIG